MRSVQAGRIVHALLFTGPHGSGKRTLARLFAQALFCRGVDRPCGVCPACKQVMAGSHPDVHIVRPEKRSISVKVIRELIRRMSLRPYEGDRQIAIIEQADCMTPGAQNALLKTLESPSGDSLFFLISDVPVALLPTILSRVQTVRLGDLSVEACADVLAARGMPPERAALLSGMAQGSVGRALELDADGDFMPLRERVLTSLEQLCAGRAAAGVAGAAALLEDEKGTEAAVLDIMELWARDLMAVQSGARPYEASDAARLARCGLDGMALLKGVIRLRMQLAGNVSWPNALENMYFHLTESANNRRTTLAWQR